MVPEPPPFARGVGLVLTLGMLFIAVAAGAYPVARRLTRRLEALKQGVEDFGAGELTRRVDASGRDEVAAVAASFNAAAERVQALVASHRSLLANASHELRSPLARLKMALAMNETATPEQAGKLKREIELNIAELDALVEEVLLASRLDAQGQTPGAAAPTREPVDLLSLVVEEVARFDAELAPSDPAFVLEGRRSRVLGDERLLRRALRNLLENARRYGGREPAAVALRTVVVAGAPRAEIHVCDRGPGVPEAQRERIFEPFYRLPGHAEQAGGVGLGLSLVRQIARHHGGDVRCEAREGGGSCFVITLPWPSAATTAA
jgi:signal transduction histidine kinase